MHLDCILCVSMQVEMEVQEKSSYKGIVENILSFKQITSNIYIVQYTSTVGNKVVTVLKCILELN